MFIASIETFATEFVAPVRLRTGDGDEGRGQVSPYKADITAEILHRQIAPQVLGMDAGDIDAVTQRDISGPDFEISNGNLQLSELPGRGVEINPEWIALSRYRVSYNEVSS